MSTIQNLRRGDVFYADLSPIVGSEQGGVRPVVIIQNNIGNRYSPTTIVATFTSSKKKDLPTHVLIPPEEAALIGLRSSTILLEQVRTLDKSRLIKFIGHLPNALIEKVDAALSVSCALNKFSPSVSPVMHRGSIYYADLGQVVGSEQGGVRPVVIIQNDVGNFYAPTTIVATITSSQKKVLPTHVPVPVELSAITGLHESTILLEQVRTLDKTRLKARQGWLPDEVMGKVDAALNISFSIDRDPIKRVEASLLQKNENESEQETNS